jgi:hypothetical protein
MEIERPRVYVNSWVRSLDIRRMQIVKWRRVFMFTPIGDSGMRNPLAILALIIPGALPAVALSDTVPDSPEVIVARHMTAIDSGDVEGAAADYAYGAVFITPMGETKGKPAIHKALAAMLPKAVDTAGARAPVVIKQKFFTKEIGYIVWVQNAGKPEEMQGSDTFVVRDGKIVAQTVVFVPMHPQTK